MKLRTSGTGCSVENKNFGVYPGLDLLKMLLAFLIIIRHCGQIFYGERDVYNLYHTFIVSGLSTVGVPTFFCISGFLFYLRENDRKRIEKQIKRLFKLYIVWSVIYFPVRVWGWRDDDRLLEHLVRYVQEAIFGGTYYHLWYLRSLAVALFLTSLSRCRVNKRTVCIAGALFVIGLCGDSYSNVVIMWGGGDALELYRKVFITTRNGLFVGVPFVLLGKFFAESQEWCLEFARKWRRVIFAGLLISIVLLMAESYYLYDRYHNLVNNILICGIPFAICSFLLFVGINSIFKENILVFSRKMSTLMFCCHPLIISVLYAASEWMGVERNIVCYTAVSVVITCIFSYIVVWLSKRIKVLGILF